MRDLAGRVAVVTGAASGIGLALAQRFSREGMKVVLADIEAAALRSAVDAIREQRGGEVCGVETDVTKAASVEHLANRAIAAFGSVHLLCNNAGVTHHTGEPMWESSVEDWRWLVDVNLWGVAHGIRTFVPLMLAHGEEAHVMNTASAAAFLAGGGIYGATKHAVASLTESLQLQLRQSGSKIGVSLLCPGFVATGIARAGQPRPVEYLHDAAPSEAQLLALRQMERRHALMGHSPDHVAELALRAIQDERFYVFTHELMEAPMRQRVEDALAGKEPQGFDAAARRRARATTPK